VATLALALAALLGAGAVRDQPGPPSAPAVADPGGTGGSNGG
jgi:hypothetical protein